MSKPHPALDSVYPAGVIDLHSHTFHSDGELGPAELARRAYCKGYAFLGLSDHVDQSNIKSVLLAAIEAAKSLSGEIGLTLLAGIELTHVPPSQIAGQVALGRDLGADFVVVHGESLVEPVAPGTNLAAIKAKCDVLAHPGLLTRDEVALAAKNEVYLELSARGGHNRGNGHVAALALKLGAKLLINSDLHAPKDLLTPVDQKLVGLGAGLSEEQFVSLMDGALSLAKKLAAKGGRLVKT
ncbi:MAG: histidinol phosphate phosphatase domain-containing protein [Deltaproteobacteria bacterium]|jgi:histidinol phosphatase-like PHP family hydrolase|nr:histidinol phosphate phosphatase domain-containing protein [Deltaproteobacteria bacterium]